MNTLSRKNVVAKKISSTKVMHKESKCLELCMVSIISDAINLLVFVFEIHVTRVFVS